MAILLPSIFIVSHHQWKITLHEIQYQNNELIQTQVFILAKRCYIDNRTKSNTTGLLAAYV